MKLTRILAIPFALTADVVTLGKMGEGSFTQDLFRAEAQEQADNAALEALKVIADIIKAAK